jgi:hypothetical protein
MGYFAGDAVRDDSTGGRMRAVARYLRWSWSNGPMLLYLPAVVRRLLWQPVIVLWCATSEEVHPD